MTRMEAIIEVGRLSSGTVATIIGNGSYDEIAATRKAWMHRILKLPQYSLNACDSWVNVVNLIQERRA